MHLHYSKPLTWKGASPNKNLQKHIKTEESIANKNTILSTQRYTLIELWYTTQVYNHNYMHSVACNTFASKLP